MDWITLILLTVLTRIASENQTCRPIGENGFLEFSKEGDFNIAGVFSMTQKRTLINNNYQAHPYSVCKKWNYRELKFARTMMFTVEEINKDVLLLPGVTLGYKVYNGCGTENLIRASIEAITGDDSQNCSGRALAVLGHSSSGVSEDINTILSVLSVPQLSHLSTCTRLSNKIHYPTFFRTVPSDRFQIKALIQLMKLFNWRWVGVIYSVDTYAKEDFYEFIQEAKKEGICVEYSVVYKRTSKKRFREILETLNTSSSNVVLMFMSLSYAASFLEGLKDQNITGKQWVGSESWIAQADLASAEKKHILNGALGFALPQASIPGLAEFLLSLKPSDEPKSAIIQAIWENFFDCSFSPSNTSNMCSGTEDLQTVSNDYTDVRYFREENYVYTSVYSVAYALQMLLQCQNGVNPANRKSCAAKYEIQPKLVLENLWFVNFTTKNGAKVFFDENGDSVGHYDLMNWQMKEDGSVAIVKIGQFDNSFPEGKKIQLTEHTQIIWGGHFKGVFLMYIYKLIFVGPQDDCCMCIYLDQMPKSVCREPCPPGTRKAMNKNKPVCCFDCFECPDGSISNQTNAVDCLICPSEFWPNAKKDRCLPKATEYLSYKEVMGALLAGSGAFGVLLSLLISIIFFTHKETPIVRANNSKLSFLLLFSIKLCFMSSFTFIGRPTLWSCMLRYRVFSITFVLCISCVLGRTVVILMACKATIPFNNVLKWCGPLQLRVGVLIFIFIQSAMCILCLTIKPPVPNMNTKYYKEIIILECALGSFVGFWVVLSYIGLFAVLCFILAFLARNLPGHYNEAKQIAFSMLIFCAVWITFVPAYISSSGKFTVAVEIFAILASSFGLLLSIFFPTCNIILLKPEKKT